MSLIKENVWRSPFLEDIVPFEEFVSLFNTTSALNLESFYDLGTTIQRAFFLRDIGLQIRRGERRWNASL